MSARAKRDLLDLHSVGASGIEAILSLSHELKKSRGTPRTDLAGKTVATIYDKPSTRTRVSIEVAVAELGGHPLLINAGDTQMGRGEPLADTARVLSRMVHAITWRTGPTKKLRELAQHATIPVINALTDEEHPLQILADLMAVAEARGDAKKLRYAWLGDGNNVARSWIEAAGLLGLSLVVATPADAKPPQDEVDRANREGGKVELITDPDKAFEGADVLITDTWISMGQEAEAAERKKRFAGFCVSKERMAKANDDARVLHCLPAYRGYEIDAEVLDGPQSLAWEAAEARLHTAKATLVYLFSQS